MTCAARSRGHQRRTHEVQVDAVLGLQLLVVSARGELRGSETGHAHLQERIPGHRRSEEASGRLGALARPDGDPTDVRPAHRVVCASARAEERVSFSQAKTRCSPAAILTGVEVRSVHALHIHLVATNEGTRL